MDTTNTSVADNDHLVNSTVVNGDVDNSTVVSGDVVNSNLVSGNVDQPPCLLDATLAVKVALHIRPLIEAEQVQGCKDCITVVPGRPQVQIGHRSFTFDHVYGSTGSPSLAIFEECVAPLVEGLFHGYNATVLAYGQTGSGKTYTMGTAFVERSSGESIIPHVMETIFKKMETQKESVEFQLRVSFIEILNEEVHDLLDMALSMHGKNETSNGFGSKPCIPTKPSIQIREAPNGEIFLAGVTEIHVNSLEEMASCLEQGSHSRTTASTNMNTHSSRSHAIFSIALDQKQKWDALQNSQSSFANDIGDDFLCAKLHLVDLAGSERAKRTGTEGIRFKEGIHINKGLLALGNVISALGDEKKRKEGGHVPYRDSKLTRLLQDSLGGNSRTVMIACVSPADSNAEETINTLKYANRARNIQNRPIVNRDPMVVELQRLRQQLELVQSELLCLQTGEGSTAETEMLKQRIALLEESNKDLQCELEDLRNRLQHYVQLAMEAEVEKEKISCKLTLSDRGEKRDENDDYNECIEVGGLLQSCLVKVKELDDEKQWMQENGSESFGLSVHYSIPTAVDDADGDCSRLCSDQADTLSRMLPSNGGEESNERENELASKELEHSLFQECLDRQLQELNRKLQQKEEEMKAFLKLDSLALKQYFEKKLDELEEEKAALQREKDALMVEYESLVSASDERNHKMHDTYLQKSKILESQISDLKKKQENQAQLIKEKQQSEEAARRLQEEIQRIKTQKVQLQQKMKQESEQFRQWKDSREKELLQLRKEWRRNEHEMHKLQALNQRQKMVLQRKTEEAALATRRLKELLEARKLSARSNLPASANSNGPAIQKNDKDVKRWVDNELQVAVHIHEARCNYERQANSRSAVALELAKLKQEERQFKTFMNEENGVQSFEHTAASLTASHTRLARIRLLEAMLNASSSVLVSMASELSEAEERERCFGRLTRSQNLRTMADAKRLLKYVFNEAIYARCQLWDKEMENKEFKEKVAELTEILRQSESLRKEMERQKYLREDAIAKALCTSTKIGATTSLNFDAARDTSGSRPQLRYLLRSQQSQSDGYSDSSSETSGNFESQKDMETGSIFYGSSKDTQSGKPWKWKHSNRRWLLPFRWKWQKPWRLSQLIRHGDDTVTRPRQSKGTGAFLQSK